MTCENEQEHIEVPTGDGYPHHFEQGPADLWVAGAGQWQFTYYVQPILGPWRERLYYGLHAVLDDVVSGWQRAPVVISEVPTWQQAHAVAMLSASPQPSGRYIPAGQLGPKAVVMLAGSPRELWWPHLVNHEFGHALFRMHDHYRDHEGFVYSGVMSTYEAALHTGGWPSEEDIADAIDWLHGQARHVHPH